MRSTGGSQLPTTESTHEQETALSNTSEHHERSANILVHERELPLTPAVNLHNIQLTGESPTVESFGTDGYDTSDSEDLSDFKAKKCIKMQ